MVKLFQYLLMGLTAIIVAACDQIDFSLLSKSMSELAVAENSNETSEVPRSISDLGALTGGLSSALNFDAGFATVMRQAVERDPNVVAAKSEAAASIADLRSIQTGRDINFKATLLGGIEDVSDETAGVAAVLSADRVLYDGGILDAKIDSGEFYVKSTEQIYLATRAERALTLANAWIDLERYQSLRDLIDSRLLVLDPLLVQLEEVASAGVGDVSQVAAAQRVVSSILVVETDVLGQHEIAKIAFKDGFGSLPTNARYDETWVSKTLSVADSSKLAENSPGLLAAYWAYRAAEASVVAIQAKDDFNIAFQVKLQRPFGGSVANSDESLGLALVKNFYRGDQLKSQIDRAAAIAKSKSAQVSYGYQQGKNSILKSRQVIKTMEKAISLARTNVESSRNEVNYLRKQLIIGGSTLESVLSAEARLYDAESKEIGFIAERRKAEASISAITGQFIRALDSD